MIIKRVSTVLIRLGIIAWLYAQPLLGAAQPENHWPVERALYEVNLDYFPNRSFRELTERIPRLADLGINVIYLLPIWETAGSQYLIRDYYKMDASHGTPDDLRNLVQAAHKHGIRLILDLVTSLTFDGSYILTDHPDWILKDDAGVRQRFYPFPDWGWALDCTNPGLIEYFTEVVRYYRREFSIDGWRIDSPMNNYDPKKVSTDHSRLPLLRALKTDLKKKNPETLFACEITSPTFFWGDDDTNDVPLFDEVCEASYHYDFCGFMGGNKTEGFHYGSMEGSPANGKMKLTLLDKIVHGEATSKEFVQYVNTYPILHNQTRAVFIENHDTERVSWAFPEQHRALFTLIATMPGVPVIHAGQEIASTQPNGHGGERKGSPVIHWSQGDRQTEAFYRQILRVRRENAALVYGKLHDVWKSGDRTIAYLRHHEKNVVLVVLSFQGKSTRTVVAIPGELRAEAHRGYRLRDLVGETDSLHKGGDLAIDLPPNGFRVLRLE